MIIETIINKNSSLSLRAPLVQPGLRCGPFVKLLKSLIKRKKKGRDPSSNLGRGNNPQF